MPAPTCCSDFQPASRLTRLWRLLWKPAPNARLVNELAQTAVSDPALRQWLLVIASEPTRLRRTLLARAGQELRSQPGHAIAASALEQLEDAALLHAVTEALFRRHGLEPLAPAQRTGRGARVRLAELAALLQARDSDLLPA